jgi:hypothetical protein
MGPMGENERQSRCLEKQAALWISSLHFFSFFLNTQETGEMCIIALKEEEMAQRRHTLHIYLTELTLENRLKTWPQKQGPPS